MGIIAGRIGNLMNGSDTVGRLTSLPIGFTWPEWAKGFPGICPGIEDISQVYRCAELLRGPVHLTQIYGALVGLILLPLSYYWLRKKP
ncbi:prolipoprotein diacylglyceryl transferase family protein, partial [Acinetobacter baumannii]